MVKYDCVIIGKGPAGITAGIYLKRANKKVLVIGKDGGALDKTEKIENYYGFNYISGKELIQRGLEQAKYLDIELDTDEVIGVKLNEDENVYVVKTRNREYEAETLILATGTNRKEPKIKGIKEFAGKGVSYCAICDAFFYRNKDVAVLGSGDYALSEAEELLPIAKTITILTNGEELVENRSNRAEEVYSKVKTNNKQIAEFRGDTTLQNVKFEDNTDLNINGVFVAIGTASSTDLAKKLGAIVENNKIVVNSKMETNVQGLYACGDCVGPPYQIAKAVYEGMVAGIEAINYLKKKSV